MSDFKIYELANGIRVVHKEVTNTQVAHCGFVLDIGSRDELEHEVGLAHFWEHMAFKGTNRRKSFHILNRLESVGGELNAYTTKEKIYFYASALDKHYEKSLELLHDITFNSTFPAKEIEREKGVILEEMAMYRDTPEDAINDEFDGLIFDGHPLGNNILGTEKSVKSFKHTDFKKFLEANLNTERLIFASIGNISFEKVKKLAEKYLSDIPKYSAHRERQPVTSYHPRLLEEQKAISQAHCIIGRTAYSINDDKRVPFFMLNHLLGGPVFSSRLNMILREKKGYVYTVEANYSSFTDTGLMGIYFGTEKRHLNHSIKIIKKEMARLREVPLGTVQLHNLKEQIKGQLAMADESNSGMMQMMGKSILDLGRIDSVQTLFDKIDALSAKDLQEVANEIYVEDQLSILKYIPQNGVHRP